MAGPALWTPGCVLISIHSGEAPAAEVDARRVIGLLISSWEAFSAGPTDEGRRGYKSSYFFFAGKLMINLSGEGATEEAGRGEMQQKEE